MNCEGACETTADGHRGPVQLVVVSGGKSWPTGHSWGRFNYCDQAIETDLERGFVVRPVLDALSLPPHSGAAEGGGRG